MTPLLALLLVAAPVPAGVGHVRTQLGSATFTETSVFSSSVSLARDRTGSWLGKVGEKAVELEAHPDSILGEPATRLRGPGSQLVVVHHKDRWYAKGTLFGLPVRVVYPDHQALDGWKRFHFDGIAAQADPPFLPFVLALWAAEADREGRLPLEVGEPDAR
ncbi:MAG: hypothetical protein JST54_11255 [Deltaproteobacteria bacterium]|nr:hypothetical protein [Deltaproteobacteria bacterium]